MGPITFGTVTLPWELVWTVVAFVVFRVWLSRHEKDDEVRKFWAERVSWAVLVGLLVWKLTPVLTRWDDVMANPLMLLYDSGGLAGLLGGSGTAAGITAMSLLQIHKEKKVGLMPELASLGAGLTVFVALLLVAPVFEPRTASALTTVQKQAVSIFLPDFEGGGHALADYRGKVAVVNFWASWCLPCRAEFPEFRLAQERHLKNAVFVGVAQTGTEKNGVADSRAFAVSQRASWTQLEDRDGFLAEAFHVQALPTTLVFDPQGNLVERRVGAVDLGWLISVGSKYGR